MSIDKKLWYGKDHPVVAFIVLLMFFVFLDFYMSAIPNAQKVEQYVSVVKVLDKLFPEGRKYYLIAVDSVSNALAQARSYGVKEPIAFLVKGGSGKVLLMSWASKYLLAFGALYGFLYKVGFLLVVFPVLLLVVLVYRNLSLLAPLWDWLRAFYYAPVKSWDVIKLTALHLANPVPASISHHNPKEGDLLDHSLRVARHAFRKGEGLDKRLLALASLLHDIGKIRLYRKEKFQSVSAPSPVAVDRQRRSGERWVSLEVNQKVVNFITQKEIQKRFNLPNIPQEVWKVVAEADRKATEEELRKGVYKVHHLIKDVLAELEYLKPKKDGWRVKDKVFVLAHAFNRKLTAKLLMEDPLLPLDLEPSSRDVHVVTYSLVADKKVPLLWEVDGKRADELGLFDLKVRDTVFHAVYCFDLTKINLDIPQQVKEGEVEVIERGDKAKGEKAVGGEKARRGGGVSDTALPSEGGGEQG